MRQRLLAVPIAVVGVVTLSCGGDVAGPTARTSESTGVASGSPLGPGRGIAAAVNSPPVLDVRTAPGAAPGSPYPVIQGVAPLFVRLNLCRSSDPDAADSLRFDVHWGDGTKTGPDGEGAGTSLEDGGGKTGCDGKDCCRHRHEYGDGGSFVIEAGVTDKHLEDQSRGAAIQARTVQRFTVNALSQPEPPPPPPPAPAPGPGLGPFRYAFLTANRFTGNLGGLVGADAVCQAEAASMGLPGTYLAWLSDPTGSPSSRFVQSSIPYRRPDLVLIANDWADLTDGSLQNPFAPFFDFVWTNTRTDGSEGAAGAASDHCLGWTSGNQADSANIGTAGSAASLWTENIPNYPCNGIALGVGARLYCFQR